MLDCAPRTQTKKRARLRVAVCPDHGVANYLKCFKAGQLLIDPPGSVKFDNGEWTFEEHRVVRHGHCRITRACREYKANNLCEQAATVGYSCEQARAFKSRLGWMMGCLAGL